MFQIIKGIFIFKNNPRKCKTQFLNYEFNLFYEEKNYSSLPDLSEKERKASGTLGVIWVGWLGRKVPAIAGFFYLLIMALTVIC